MYIAVVCFLVIWIFATELDCLDTVVKETDTQLNYTWQTQLSQFNAGDYINSLSNIYIHMYRILYGCTSYVQMRNQ